MTETAHDLINHLVIDEEQFAYVDLTRMLSSVQVSKLPYSIRILLENVARCSPEALPSVLARAIGQGPDCEVPFQPNRLMFHDTTCLPALADFAGMRDVVAELGGDPKTMNPLIPAVLTIDHSVIVEHYAEADAVEQNLDIDFRRNSERYLSRCSLVLWQLAIHAICHYLVVFGALITTYGVLRAGAICDVIAWLGAIGLQRHSLDTGMT